MKRTLLTLVALSSAVYADLPKEKQPKLDEIKEQGFYIKLGTGASFARKADISAPTAVWDPAIQGYDGSLGTRPIILGGVGYDSPFVSTDVTASYRPNFKYSKFQTPSAGDTVGALGQKTRRFNLDVTSLVFNLYFNGRGYDPLNWKVSTASSIFPFIGGGVGVSQVKISDFRSTGLPSIVVPLPSFASENQRTIRYRFTYQIMAGLEYRFRDVCALSAGYRWFDVSRFNGPRYLRDQNGNAIDVQNDTWKIKFAANEAFLEFKIFL